MNSWLLLNSGPCEAAYNMALDEALLEQVSRLGKPVLRFYGWTETAATFGYFQKFAEVERATHLRPLIRRPTGGGIVPHDRDWTYGAVFPPNHEWHSLPAEESYRRIHDWLRLAFAALDVQTDLAGSRQPAASGRRREEREEAQASNAECGVRSAESSQSLFPPSPGYRGTSTPAATGITGQCFVGHEKSDLLWHGKKIAGAAQRRNRLGLLIQGSVQPPPLPLKREDFAAAMGAVAVEKFQAVWTELIPDHGLRRSAEELTAQKYSQSSYNRKR